MIRILHTDTTIGVDLVATQSGTHTLRLKFNGQYVELRQTFATGDPIVFPNDDLNEDYLYSCVDLLLPDGTAVQLDEVQIRIALR